MLETNRKLAEDLGVRGTPAIAIGDALFPGAVPYPALKKMVQEAHEGKTPEFTPDMMTAN
jgi:protein-disulfide isomerase